MSTERVLRWPVPVDDQPHEIGCGTRLHVACRDASVVDVWTREKCPDDWPDSPVLKRLVQVFGTGQPLPAEAAEHVGSAISPEGSLVWHVFLLGDPA